MLDSDSTAVVIVEGDPPGGVENGPSTCGLRGTRTSTRASRTDTYTTDLRPGEPVGRGEPLRPPQGTDYQPLRRTQRPGRHRRSTHRTDHGWYVSTRRCPRACTAVSSHTRATAIQDAINRGFQRQQDETPAAAAARRSTSSSRRATATIPAVIEPGQAHRSPTRGRGGDPLDQAFRAGESGSPRRPGGDGRPGPKSIPILRGLYDYPEEGPPAALTAGPPRRCSCTADLVDQPRNGSPTCSPRSTSCPP